MHEFRVWAPSARKVDLSLTGGAIPMDGPDARGWWCATVEHAGPGTDYGFSLDDDPSVYPDPRSAWQPDGVHGLSRVYDHAAYDWQDMRWQALPLSSAVFYEMHIGTFTAEGTFDSAIGRLDYLQQLGVTHLEVMPVAEFAGDRGWGYDGVHLFAPTRNYGGPDAMKRFVDACHARGLAVILDVVYNHFGPVGSYAGNFGPYLTELHRTPWGAAVNFEGPGSDEVRRFFCDNAVMWMRDYHIDGLRLDAVHEFVDRSAVHFLEQLSAEVEVLGATLARPLVLIAECDLNDPKVVRPREAGGYGVDAQWSDDFHHALFTLMHVEESGGGYFSDFGTFGKLVKALTDVFVYDGGYSQYRRRSHGRRVQALSAHHFVVFIQNHDQVGNRATGERLQHIVGYERSRVAIGLVLTAPFVPLLFQGEEYAAATPFLYFADHEDPEMAKAVSAGRKKEFAAFGFDSAEIPDPEVRETFERSKLNWSEVDEPEHAGMLEWVRALIRLRRHSRSLNDGDLSHLILRSNEDDRWLAMRRGAVEVLVNLGAADASFVVPEGWRLALCSRPGVIVDGETLRLPPDSLAILSSEEEER
ncbi:MAG: malto-oligosyltrehalose trehalohydrolase [Acidobacteriota bacterium]|nr:malto-oligosyltrehalose trehalohydrolase [Acidobacteriota bacterium]